MLFPSKKVKLAKSVVKLAKYAFDVHGKGKFNGHLPASEGCEVEQISPIVVDAEIELGLETTQIDEHSNVLLVDSLEKLKLKPITVSHHWLVFKFVGLS